MLIWHSGSSGAGATETWHLIISAILITGQYVILKFGLTSRKGFYDSDLIWAHPGVGLGGSQISKILPASSPGDPRGGPSSKWPESVVVENGYIEVSSDRGLIRLEKLVWVKYNACFSQVARTQDMSKTMTSLEFGSKSRKCIKKSFSLSPLGGLYWYLTLMSVWKMHSTSEVEGRHRAHLGVGRTHVYYR